MNILCDLSNISCLNIHTKVDENIHCIRSWHFQKNEKFFVMLKSLDDIQLKGVLLKILYKVSDLFSITISQNALLLIFRPFF